MNRTWQLTDIEFVVLWRDAVERRLPAPFVYTSRVTTSQEADRAFALARGRLRDIADPFLGDVVRAMAQPDIRMVVRGWETYDLEDPTAWTRLLAVRQADRAYLVTQLPGETVAHSGGFTVTECHVLELAAAVVARLPEATAGRGPDVVLPAAPDVDLDYEFGQSEVRESHDEPHWGGRVEEFLTAPPTGFGKIEISQGRSRFGPRGVVGRTLGWRDVVEDGRYLLVPDNPPMVIGVDCERLTGRLNFEIAAVVRAIKDERSRL
ncbi:ESX secretion-associated protein EspG [Nocardia sp. NPDC127579]|uniref:ESX secretion-associated protein EspG n=1 Tax=Nocardia sp. NPDC127579 TaxID=3345402 RepID=UPI00362E116D